MGVTDIYNPKKPHNKILLGDDVLMNASRKEQFSKKTAEVMTYFGQIKLKV